MDDSTHAPWLLGNDKSPVPERRPYVSFWAFLYSATVCRGTYDRKVVAVVLFIHKYP